MLKIIISIGATLLFISLCNTAELSLYDFNNAADPTSWVEQSDTVRTGVGMSKAALVLHQNGSFRRAVFFALLNPQSNGAGFAGMRILENHDLSAYNKFALNLRAQGTYKGYKVVLRHAGEENYTFEQFFTAPIEFSEVYLPFADFKAYFRGQEVTNETISMDFSQTSAIGLQFYGGVYEDVTQSGPGVLEIDYIKVTSD